jgi:hypothetical protein
MADEKPIKEPDNSTVDDWLGQEVQRDTEVAERVSAEAGSEAEAERRFEQEAHGKERYEENYPRPE